MTSPWFRRRIQRLFQAVGTRPCLEVLEDRMLLSFGAPILSSTDVGPSGMATGDLNGDGKLDVVTANTINNSVSVLFGRGDGTFQAPVNYAVGSKPVRVGVGSLRGNGLLDLVAVNNNDKSLTLLLNNGNGTFRNAGTVTTDPGPTSVVLADWNGDGKLDLAVGATDGSQTFNVDILPGNGNGTFGPLTRVSSHDWGSSGPADLITGDFNRDGKLDLVAANYGYSVAYFQGNGDGTFQTGVGTSTDHRNFGVITADLQGDGILDLISAGDTYGWVSTLRGNGNGTFQAAQRIGGGSSFSAGAADFRGTGKTDLVVVDQPGDTLTWLQNAGDGTFPTTQTFPLASGPGAKGNGLVVGDFNGDGKPDVAVALTQFNWVSVLLDQPDATQLAVSAADTSVAGTTLSVTVTAKMPNGSTSTSYTGRVHFTATDGNAVLPLDYTFTTADQGTHTFTVTFKTAGPQSLTVTDAALGFTAAKAVTVTPAAADHLLFGQQPSNAVAGQALSPAVTVRVLDLFGNLVTSNTSNVTVALSTNPGASTLSGTTTIAAVNGIATFSNLSLDKAAAGYTLQATDGSLIVANSNSFNINPAAAHHLAFGVVPSGTAIGKTISPAIQVQVVDQFGNLVITDSSTVTVALGANPAGGTLSGTTTVGAVNGIATFSNLAIDKAAAGYTLQATDGSLGAAVSTTFDITSLPHHLAFGQGPSNTTAGQAINPAVAVVVLDQFGSPVTNDSSTVTVALAANPLGGTLSGTLTATVVNGVATFSNLSLDKAGSGYTLQATDGNYGGVVSSAFSITPGAAHHLAFGVAPSNATAGIAMNPTVQVRVLDPFSNLVTTDNSNVTVALGTNPAGGTLSGTLTMPAVNGVATFSNLSLDKAAAGYTLQATDGTLSAATSSSFSITPAAAHHLAFGVAPSNTTAGVAMNPAVTVRVLDQFGNLVITDTSSVTVALASNPAGGTLSGTLTMAAVNGVATFSNLSLDKAAAGYTLQASDGSLGTATSGTFSITAAAAHHLVFGVGPNNTIAGQPFNPALQVRVLDAFGNLVTTDNSNVTLALAANPAGGTLSGTVTTAAVNGIATFAHLSLNKLGTGYTLQASDGPLGAAVSSSFSVVAGPAVQLLVTTQPPASILTNVGFGLVVTLEDALGNLATAYNGAVNVALANNPGGGSLHGTVTVAAVNGVATFAGLSLDKPGSGYTLRVTASNLTATTSAMVVQTPNQVYVSAVYFDVLQRPVDAVGLTYWSTQLDQGAPRSSVAQQITHSAEYFAIVIRAAYRKFLGRAADDAGLAYWINRMQNGLTDQQLEAGFIGSAEYYTHSGGTNQLWIEAMYHDLLGRSPDAAGEIYWLQKLAAGADRATVAYGFAASTEREGQLVQQDYLTFLHRTASQSEVAYWVNAFTQGLTNEDIITGFVSSEEYFRAHSGG
jgi:hypothetical protein